MHKDNLEQIKENIVNNNLDIQLLKSLNLIKKTIPKNREEFASHLGYLRSFFDELIGVVAKKIAESKKETIPKIPKSTEFTKHKSYLKSIEVINEGESKLISAIHRLLSSECGSHSLSTSKEKYLFLYKISIEIILLIFQNARKMFPKEERKEKERAIINQGEFESIMKINANNAKKIKYQIAFTLAWESGLAIKEIVGLVRKDFDFNKREIQVVCNNNLENRFVPMPEIFNKSHLKYISIGVDSRAIQKEFVKSAIVSGVKDSNPNSSFQSLRNGFISHCFNVKNLDFVEIKKLTGLRDMRMIDSCIKQ